MNGAYRPFASLSRSFHRLKDRRRENLRLKEELVAARLKIDALKEERRENLRLRRSLEFSSKIDYPNILAEVIGRGSPRMPASITVGAGSDRGVIVGLPVIDRHGIVGKVTSVSANSSIVQLLTDPNLKISAMDARSRIQGIVSPTGKSGLEMENVPMEADIRSGDPIISSGLGGAFPRGLLVGSVSRVVVPQSGLFSKVEIEPAAKLSTLEEVFIIFSGMAGTGVDSTTADSLGGAK